MTQNLLEITDVAQSFRVGFWLRRTEVLHGVSLAVPRGSIYGFLGANGAGKTTLIQLIVGLREPTRGSVRLGGDCATSARARSRMGYLPERPYFHEHLTGEGLLRYFGALSGLKRSDLLARIPRVLETVGMRAARDVELRRYSKGMLQRIGIAQAILHDPEFLVLDEPMSGLDPLGRKEMRELITSLASEGRTILFSSHVIPDVEAVCDRVAVIQKGKLIGQGPIRELLERGPAQVEVGFSDLAVEEALSLVEYVSLRAIPEGARAVVADPSRGQVLLRALLDKGARILWVTPVRPSLEELFVRER